MFFKIKKIYATKFKSWSGHGRTYHADRFRRACITVLFLTEQFYVVFTFTVPALKFTVQPKGTIAEQGSEVVLDCSATGSDSSVSFRWLLNDTLLLIDGKKYQLSGQGSLKVHRLHRIKDDGNVFRCIASNRYGSILSVKAVVHVACK